MIFKGLLLLPLIASSTDGFGFDLFQFPDWTMPTMPTFSDLFNWTLPGTAEVSGSSLNLTVLDINNETARLGCTWSGQGTANFTWEIAADINNNTNGGESAGLKEEDVGASSSILTITWNLLGVQPGDSVVASCIQSSSGGGNGTSGDNGNGTMTSYWSNMASATMTLTNPMEDAET